MTTYTRYGTWSSRVHPLNLTLESEVADALDNWEVDEDTLEAVCKAYRAAINAALPHEVALCGDEFYGPAFAEFPGYPTDEAGLLDLEAIVDSVDFWLVAEPIIDPPRHDPKLAALMARPDPFAPDEPIPLVPTELANPGLTEYEVTLTVRVQGQSMADVPGLLLEALGDHDVFPVYVRPLEGDERPDELWVDRTTGLQWVPDEGDEYTGPTYRDYDE